MSIKTLNLTPSLYQYLLGISLRENPVQAALRSETSQLSQAEMQISPEQGQFMALLIKLLNAKKTLDIGTFTGYSALAVAQAMPKEGKVVALDTSETWTAIAKKFWEQAKVADKIDLHIGPASESLTSLIQTGQSGSFDFAFIDADKSAYDDYYEKSLVLLRSGGLIAIDNVFRDGRVADESCDDKATLAIKKLNAKLHADERVYISVLPIGDGLTLAYKY